MTRAPGRKAQDENMGKFRLKCVECGGLKERCALTCEKCDSLLRAEYYQKRLTLKELSGIWRFHEWLPVDGYVDSCAGPITYKSREFARELGLKNLYISFSGYWPEKGAFVQTCAFKEYEALVSLQRARECGVKTLIVCSSGNTGRGFAYVAEKAKVHVLVVVPEKNVDRIWLPETIESPYVHLLAVRGADYFEAVTLANKIEKEGFFQEGGAKNVARRDALGTVMLDAAIKIGEMPKHYFQPISGGAGAIGVWEMAKRLLADGRFGKHLPKLHLAQNIPFVPIYKAWIEKRNYIKEEDAKKEYVREMYANVISNRNPPYSIRGGTWDALTETRGEMYAIEGNEAIDAKNIFEKLEGIDIVPAAAVGVASLISAVEKEKIDKKDVTLLNVTGGGMERLKKERETFKLKPEILKKDASNASIREVIDRI